MIPDPVVSEQGYFTYAGGPIVTDYGHEVTVQESSDATGPHVWLFISESPRAAAAHNPHLSLEQALRIHAALGQFIDGVPRRWETGAERLAEARRAVFGDEEPPPPGTGAAKQ